MFAEGFIAGVVVCAFIFAVIAATKGDRFVDQTQFSIRRATRSLAEQGFIPDGVTPKGFVYTPPDDNEIARQEIIEENRLQGKDTHISELRS